MTARRTRYRGPRPVPRTDAVAEVIKRLDAPRPGDKRPPILVIFGPPGIGAGTFLEELNRKLHGRTPRALVDCSRYLEDDVPGLLTEVKVKLSQRCPGVGGVRFRRLETGMAATREDLDFTRSRARVHRRLGVLTRREIFPSPDNIRRVIGTVAENLRIVPRWLGWLSNLLGDAAAVSVSRALAAPLFLDRYQKWHGHRDQRHPDDPLDELAELNRWAQGANQGHSALRDKRDERLLEALLADVRDAFGRGRLARPGWYSFVLLLDEADSEAGRAVLQHLEHLRRDLEIARTPVEPLLVVAASRKVMHGVDLEHYGLPDFSEPELGWLAEYVPGEADDRFPKAVHQLTAGYPAASAAVIDAACRRPEAAKGSLHDVLRLRLDDLELVTGDGPTTLEEKLLDDLVDALWRQSGPRPFPDSPAVMEALTSCAFARTPGDALWLAESHECDDLIDHQLLHTAGLWGERQTAAHRTLHCLLLRKLARREAEPTMQTINSWLRYRCAGRGELDRELYYALAEEDLLAVAHRLTGHLSGLDIDQPWLDLLKCVTAAPRRPTEWETGSPYQAQLDLAHAVVRDPTPHLSEVTRLVAGLWLANDPCTPPDRVDLHAQLALDFRGLAPDADRPMDLRIEAMRHEALAQYWS